MTREIRVQFTGPTPLHDIYCELAGDVVTFRQPHLSPASITLTADALTVVLRHLLDNDFPLDLLPVVTHVPR